MFYGAPEFSQDTDFVIHGDLENLARLQEALHQFAASVIAVLSFSLDYLSRVHAVDSAVLTSIEVAMVQLLSA